MTGDASDDPSDDASENSPSDASGDEPAGASPEEEVAELVAAVHDHLAATQERPVERGASRWIGEAEAVARDLAESDLAPAVVAERLGHVRRLLSEVDGTQDDEADEHVAAARTAVDRALDRLEN